MSSGARWECILQILLSAILALASIACGSPTPSSPAPAPSSVAHPIHESDLPVVTLTPEAEQRLAIERASVELRAVPAARRVGGEVNVPPGRALLVTAPVPGMVRATDIAIVAGARVHRGDALFRLVPIAPVDRDVRARATRDLSAAQAQLDAAEARVARVQRLTEEGAGSQRVLEEATAARDIARAEVAAAQARSRTTQQTPLLSDVSMTVRATDDGIVRTVSVGPGQVVVAGAPLIEIVAVEALWVRVPVYAGDLSRVDPRGTARVQGLGAEDRALEATPVEGPPTADPASATVDRYYALGESSVAFRPGERVLVSVPLAGEERGLVVPFASIVRDASGGTWVYTCGEERSFVRARVDVARRANDLAILTRGPAPGTCVVSVGAAEVFGAEFPPGH